MELLIQLLIGTRHQIKLWHLLGGEVDINSANISAPDSRIEIRELKQVRLFDGARLSTDVIGSIGGLLIQTLGNAGDISITARESLKIRETSPESFTSAIASSSSLLAVGH